MDKPVRRGFRLGCLGWCLVCFSFVAITVASGWIWLSSHSDLDALETDLRANGLAATWDDLAYRTASPERIADWKRLLHLGSIVKLYQPADIVWSPHPGTPAPDELRDHRAAEPPALAIEIDGLLDRLGTDPVFTLTRRAISDQITGPSELRQLARWYSQRIAIAASHDIDHLFAIATRLVPIREPPFLIEQLSSTSIVPILLSAVASRIGDLDPEQRSRIAAIVRALETIVSEQAVQSMRGEAVFMISVAREMGVRDVFAMASFNGAILGGSQPGVLDGVATVIGLRAARATLIRDTADLACVLDRDSRASIQIAHQRSVEARMAKLPAWTPLGIGWNCMFSSVTMVVTSSCSVRDQLLVFAAELDGTPWPVDSLDPSGKPWRRLERYGQLIGAYSVGNNGIDDHGSGDDRCLDLYGRCRPPKTISPP